MLPKLIYVRLGGDLRAMGRMVRKIREGLRVKGIKHDEKPFKPHITIGKVKAECGRAEKIEIGKTVGKLYDLDIPQIWQVERVRLYESELLSVGSRYRIIGENWLGNF
jgi:2'-5' RNA ligase